MSSQHETNWIGFDPVAFTDALTGELDALAATSGLVLEPISKCSHLSYLGQLSKMVSGRADHSDAREAISLIEAHLGDLGGRSERSLSVALGVSVTGANPSKRFDAAVTKEGLPSRSTVMRVRREGALADLSRYLVDVGLQLEQLIVRDDLASGKTYSIDHIQALFTIGENRSATCDDLTFWVTGRTQDPEPTHLAHAFYGSDRSEEAISYRAVFGCTIEPGDAWYEDHYAYAKITLGRSLAPGVRHVFRYAIDIHSDEPCSPFLYSDPANQVDISESTIDFGPHRPRRLWTFHQLDHFRANIADCRQQTPVDYDQSRFVTERFENLQANFASGIAWEW